MNKQTLSFLSVTFLIFATFSTLFCVDNPHFFKAPYHNATKWRRGTALSSYRKWLSIFDAHYANGSTHRSRNSCGDSVGTFDLYGNHNLLYLATNVPEPEDIDATVKGYVDALEAKRVSFEGDNPADKETFGQVSFSGKCEVDEFVFNFKQNLFAGLFLELNIPIRRVWTGPFELVDKSPSSATQNDPYTQTDTVWLNFINNLEDILQEYGLGEYPCGTRSLGFGDIGLIAGWQHKWIPSHKNKSFASWLEYLKFALKGGVLFPTSPHRKFTRPFAIEGGYNQHWGFPIRTDVIFGLSTDIYFGTYAGFIFFTPKTHNNYPVQTHINQNGFIKLYRTKVDEEIGTVFDAGAYLKLDHFFKGLSALIGYSYNRQNDNSITLEEGCDDTNNTIIDNDLRLKSWYQHVLHIMAQYDFGTNDFFRCRKWKPRVSIFYDHPFDGKRAIINAMVGGSFGMDFSWCF